MKDHDPLGRAAAWPRIRGAALAALVALAAVPAEAGNPQPEPPRSLASLDRPEPKKLKEYVSNKNAAIALGKALFWDMQVGSDGRTACASCHFHAGADPRSKNQVSPGLLRRPNPDTTFQVGGPNHQLRPEQFPFHGFVEADKRWSRMVRNVNDVVSSQGAFNERFVGITPGQARDIRAVVPDPVFRLSGVNTRQVEPRNSPTVINAVFNLRNFWDGRANYTFNGVNPFGNRDQNARVFKDADGRLRPVRVEIEDASLASQASGPPLSDLEMSAAGRNFPALARKLLSLRPLAQQRVDATDSHLAAYRSPDGMGLNTRYGDLIRQAFDPEWWRSATPVVLPDGAYSQMEANFSLFFGLALQLYQAELVSDRTPFDRFAEGQPSALTTQQQLGLAVFWGKGKCANCHGGPLFTNAAIKRKKDPQIMHRMLMGDGARATYDEGFYNIAVTPTNDDVGLGGSDPFGNPLSFSESERRGQFTKLETVERNVDVKSSERVAVQGAFKTPTLRNVELTAPYFHNGGALTLLQVVELYNRGGNFREANLRDLDADIQPLGLSHEEQLALVEFMRSLTDDRVRRHAAPFDHPELWVPDGHQGDATRVDGDGQGRALDTWLRLAAVGAAGYAQGAAPKSFLGLVEAWALPNLALGRPATQSSNWAFTPSAGRAVDGKTNGNFFAGSVSHTNWERNPWWQVDLGAVSELSLIEIWNRSDVAQERLKDFAVFVSDTDMTGRTAEALLADPRVGKVRVDGALGSVHLPLLPPRANGRYVRVQLLGAPDILSLAEVRVLGRRP